MEESLYTSVRRFIRFFDIDMVKGELITEETKKAFEIMRQQFEKEKAAQNANRKD